MMVLRAKCKLLVLSQSSSSHRFMISFFLFVYAEENCIWAKLAWLQDDCDITVVSTGTAP